MIRDYNLWSSITNPKIAGIGYGKIEDGAQASRVVFYPRRVIDRATFEDSKQYPEGIEHVIVEGQLAARYGEPYLPRHGTAVRRTEHTP